MQHPEKFGWYWQPIETFQRQFSDPVKTTRKALNFDSLNKATTVLEQKSKPRQRIKPNQHRIYSQIDTTSKNLNNLEKPNKLPEVHDPQVLQMLERLKNA